MVRNTPHPAPTAGYNTPRLIPIPSLTPGERGCLLDWQFWGEELGMKRPAPPSVGVCPWSGMRGPTCSQSCCKLRGKSMEAPWGGWMVKSGLLRSPGLGNLFTSRCKSQYTRISFCQPCIKKSESQVFICLCLLGC